MRDYEEAEESERKLRDKRSREADEDGFILVKQRGKKKRRDADTSKRGTGAPRSRGGNSGVGDEMDGKNKKKGTGQLQNFYRFQIREQKSKKLRDLRKKFEEDKAKIATMKAQRRFNPY